MNVLHKAWEAYRTLRRKPRLRLREGELVVITCAEQDSARGELAKLLAFPRGGVVVTGARRTHPLRQSVRLSLVSACGYGRVPPERRGSRLARVISTLQLQPLLETHVYTLDPADQLRLGLGVGLLWHPRILVVDEPAGLEDAERTAIIAAFRRVQLETRVTTVWLSDRSLSLNGLADRTLDLVSPAQGDRLMFQLQSAAG